MPAMTFAAIIRFAPVVAAGLFIASCGDQASSPGSGDENLDARGEVLGGSISDAMLPLDTVTSQSPPLSTGGGESADTDELEDDTIPLAAEAEAAPEAPSAPAPEAPAEPEDPPSGG